MDDQTSSTGIDGSRSARDRCRDAGLHWLAVGLAAGVALGVSAGSLGWGVGVGAAIGLGLQLAYAKKKPVRR